MICRRPVGGEWLRYSLSGFMSVCGVRMPTPGRNSAFSVSLSLDKISGERGSLRLYLSIPKRRIGWSSGKAAGKTPRQPRFVLSPHAALPVCFPALIDPPVAFSLSSLSEACHFVGADARDRSEDD